MMKFKKIEGPAGIPVYFEYIPEVRSVSMRWVMFVGSADDESVGAPGLYHWFEHVPFRGTKKYPNGYKDTKGLATRYGGHIGAYTTKFGTAYNAFVPTKIWKEAFSVITDLMTQPVLIEKSINAEREIIFQEIAGKKSTYGGYAGYELSRILWEGHPLGHPVLGSEDTLKSMTAEILRNAHEKGYDRSRCSLFVSGNVTEKELLTEIEKMVPLIPNRGLSNRKGGTFYGNLPEWKKGKTTVVETKFTTSLVYMFFPLPRIDTLQDKIKYSLAEAMFDFGGLDSPVYRILRENKKLVYSAGLTVSMIPGGGYWGFYAEAQAKNIAAVVSSFKEILNDAEIVSKERFEKIKTGIRGTVEIQAINPHSHTDSALYNQMFDGIVYSDQEYLDEIEKITLEEVTELICQIDIKTAHTIIFKGIDK